MPTRKWHRTIPGSTGKPNWTPLIRKQWGSLSVGPELISLDSGILKSQKPEGDTKLLKSLYLEILLIPHHLLSLRVSGFYGEQMYLVSYQGLSVSSSSDKFIGGYHLGLDYRFHPHLAFMINFQQSLGKEQHGQAHNFWLLSGTLGFSLIL